MSAALPPNWSLQFSKSQQKHYYFNCTTNERLWRDDELPNGWVSVREKGAVLFFNIGDRAGTSTSTRPRKEYGSGANGDSGGGGSSGNGGSGVGGGSSGSSSGCGSIGASSNAGDDGVARSIAASAVAAARGGDKRPLASSPAASSSPASAAAADDGGGGGGGGGNNAASKPKKKSLLSGLLSKSKASSAAYVRTGLMLDAPDKALEAKKKEEARRRKDAYQMDVERRLRAFLGDGSATELPFEPVGADTEEQSLYRFMVCECVDDYEGELLSISRGDDAERHVVVYKEGHVPADVLAEQDEVLQRAQAVAAAAASVGKSSGRRKDLYGVQTDLAFAGGADALETLNTVKRDRRTTEQIQLEMEQSRKKRFKTANK